MEEKKIRAYTKRIRKVEINYKKCSKCNINDALMLNSGKFHKWCNDCKKEYNRELYAKRNKIERKYTNAKRNYNLSKDEFINLISSKKCRICDKKIAGRNIHIDHDHKTQKIRGILCKNCNLGLGFFRDNKKFLKNAIGYLNGFQQLSLFD